MKEPRVLTDEKDGIGRITLNRPEVLNAIDQEMIDELRAALERFKKEDRVGALVLAGAGEKAFAAGADVAQLKERGVPEALAAINSTLFRELEEFPAPTFAAIHGYALGGGCELAMACDIRIAGRSAKLGQPEVNLGILAGAGAIERLPRLVGLGRAKEMLFTGAILDAEYACQIGLVNHVVDDDKVLEITLKMAAEVLKKDRLAVRLTKMSINATARADLQVGVPLDAISQAVCFESEEKHRRMGEFLAKKKKREEKS